MSNHLAAKQKGQALIELILAIALATLFLSTFVLGIIGVREALNRAQNITEANLLLQKETEGLRSIKETAWGSFATPGTYHIAQSGNTWSAVSGTTVENGFTRGFTVANVCRLDSVSLPTNCSDVGALDDPSTKQITVNVSWPFYGSESVSTSFYLTRYFGNSTWIQTIQADFNAGTHTNTVTTNNSGGEVALAASTGGSWATPTVVATVNLPGSQNANDIYVDGSTAYIVTTSGNGPELYIYDITDPTNPTSLGALDLGATGWSIVVANGYAYIATNSNNSELMIVNVANPAAPTVAGSFDAATGSDGRGVAIIGNTAYLVTDNNNRSPGYELYIVNVTNKNSPTQLGGLDLNAGAQDIVVVGNYAYIASTNNSQELQVVDISNLSLPNLVGSYNSPGNSDGHSVYVVGTTAFMTDARVNILNVANPASITLISQPNYPGNPQAIYASGNYAFLASTDNSGQFKVVDVSNPNSPAFLGQTVLGGNGLGVFALGDYAFVLSANNNAEFQIIRGGTPGRPYQTSGVFESQTFDATSSVGFNYLFFNKTEPPNTSIKIQVATNNDNLTWVFSGPDGTSSTYFTVPAAIPLTKITGRYFRFRVFFSGDGINTPSLLDTTLNYSP